MLPIEYRVELERIVFFNPDQSRVKESLVVSVRRYGVPSIVEDGPHLRLKCAGVSVDSKPVCDG